MSSAQASPKGCYLNGYEWKPAITAGPVFKLNNWNSGQPQALSTDYGQISFLINAAFGNQAWPQFVFEGSFATVWFGHDGDVFGSYRQIWAGTLGAIERDDDQNAHITLLGPEGSTLNQNLLSLTYAGTGSAEGTSDITGNLKPYAYGACTNVAPILIDGVNWVYQVDGYDTCLTTAVYENALTLGAAKSTSSASYAQLQALTLNSGEWAAAPTVGMFRLGSAPSGTITADVGSTSSVGGFVTSILNGLGIPANKIDASVAAATAHYSFYSTDQATILDTLQAAALAAYCYLITDSATKYYLASFASIKTPGNLTSNRSTLPLVRPDTIKQAVTSPQAYQVKIGHTPVYYPMSANEISSAVATIGANVDALNTAAQNAQDAADAAQASADVANARLQSMSADGVLDRTEKQAVALDVSNIVAEKPNLVSTGTGLGITTEVTNYSNAYTTLYNYITGLSPAYNDTTTDTTINRTTFNNNFNAYYTQRQNLENAIANKNATTANWTSVASRPTNLTDLNAADGGKLTGIAAGATKNIITTSSIAPASPNDGDVWVNTSVTPNVTRVRVSGAWVVGASNGATLTTGGGTIYNDKGQAYLGGDLITNQGTSHDTSNVNGMPSTTVTGHISDLLTNVSDLQNTYGDTASAAQSATAAANSASTASTAATNAQTAANNASTANTNAQSAMTAAQSAQSDAANSKTAAANSASTASTAATNASTANTNAQSAMTAAQSAQSDAANSKTAAASSASMASTAATNASTANTNAQSAMTAAQTAATNAGTANTNAQSAMTAAQTAATNASNSAGTATTQATLAVGANSAANAVAASLFPERLDATSLSFINATSGGGQGSPTAVTPIPIASYTNVTGYGQAYQLSTSTTPGNWDVGTVGVLSFTPGRFYKIEWEVAVGTFGSGDTITSYGFMRCLDGTYAQVGSGGNTSAPNAITDTTSHTFSAVWGCNATGGDVNVTQAGTIYMRPVVRITTNGKSSVLQYHRLKVTDVTSQIVAGQSASAASTSATNASASATTASQQATIATNQATAASTSAGNASTSATNAANSANNASGSANTATTQAGAAATSATNAGNSATAAAGSASTASTQATNASNSATAAAGSATSANTSAGNANTYASQASTSATNAGNSATSAATQAGVAATNATNASITAATLLPKDFGTGQPWTNGVAIGTPAANINQIIPAANYTTVTGIGTVFDNLGVANLSLIMPVGAISPIANRIYEFEVQMRCTVANSISGATISTHLDVVTLDANYSNSLNVSATGVSGYPNGESTGAVYDWTVSKIRYTAPSTSVPAYIRPRLLLNYKGSGTQGNAHYQVAYFKITDVTDVVGAANSASAAATSASSAATSATNAGNSATSASTSATNASTSAGNAQTYANNASTSATSAGNSATTATSQAGVAATNASNANLIAAKVFPDRIDPVGNYFTVNVAGDPAVVGPLPTANIINVSGYGLVYQTNPLPAGSGQFDMGARQVVPATTGKFFKVEAEYQASNIASGDTGLQAVVCMRSLAADYSSAIAVGATVTVSDTNIHTLTAIFSDTPQAGVIGWPAGTVWLRPYLRIQHTTGPTGSTVQIRRLTLTDVTDSFNASISASAAATSASNASVSATNAGISATSASTSATNASTSAGNAQTYANNASSSATSAQGYANTATTQAGVASTANTNAQAAQNAAETAAAQLLPSRLDAAGTYFFDGAYLGDPLTRAMTVAGQAKIINESGYGPVYSYTQASGSASYLAMLGVVPATTGKIYEISATFECPTYAATFTMATWPIWMDSTYAQVGTNTAKFVTFNAVGTQSITFRVSNVAPTGGLAWPSGTAYVRALTGVQTAGAGSVVYLKSVSITDVTALAAAETQATAAAGSASSASTSATNAGNSATAAAASATSASTSAGNANTYASQASTSATNAGNSANTATTQAGVAASNATAAQNSAAPTMPGNFPTDSNQWVIGDPAPAAGVGMNTSPYYSTGTNSAILTIANDSTSYLEIYTRAAVPNNQAYNLQIAVNVRQSAATSDSSPLKLGCYVRGLSSTYGYVGTASNAQGGAQNLTSSFVTYTFTVDTTSLFSNSSVSYVRPALQLHAPNLNTKGGAFEISSIVVTDITTQTKAAASATAAATSASNAATSATNAGNSATSASNSATTATTQAGNAQTYANNASTSATNASGSANTASTQAGVASTAATSAANAQDSAQATAASLFPCLMATGQSWWATNTGMNPTAAPLTLINSTNIATGILVPDSSFTNVFGVGYVFDTKGAAALNGLYPVGAISPTANSTYEFEVMIRCLTANTVTGASITTNLDFYSLDANYAVVAGNPNNQSVPGYIHTDTAGAAFDWTVWKYRYVAPATGLPAYIRPRLYCNYKGGGTQGNAQYQVMYFKITDITQSLSASNSASAAATSASTASTAATNAGNSATSASTSATNASTSAGNAQTYANNASSSATSAQGSANTATTQAGNASTSATNAGNSATAASGSASSASTSATNAGNSATAAAASATAANTSAGNANTYASQASTSATNAAGSATSAATQAGVAASNASTATAAAAALFPSDFSQQGVYFSRAQDGQNPADIVAGANDTFPSVVGIGTVYQMVGTGTAYSSRLATQGYLAPIAGRRYRVEASLNLTSVNSTTSTSVAVLWRGENNAFAFVTDIPATTTGFSVNLNTWQTISAEVMGETLGANTSVAYVRPYIQMGGIVSGTSSAFNGTVQFSYFKVTDITEQYNAANSASAAATSASNAATSATNAGNSATSASTSATNASTAATNASNSASAASTSASNASTYATNASTSASNAQGYSNTASTQAGAASSSATAAAGSATAAAGSATTASTQATNASNSASAAASSLLQATSVAASLLPQDFQQDGTFWSAAYQGVPTRTSLPANATYSFPATGSYVTITAPGNASSAQSYDISNLGALPLVPGHLYTLTANYTVINVGSGGTANAQIYYIPLNASYVYASGGAGQNGIGATGTFNVSVTMTANSVITNYPSAVMFRSLFRVNTPAGVTGVVVQLNSVAILDITDSTAAAASMTSAATYATNASTSASNAAGSATSASGFANTASTAATNASGSATNASNSATSASNSAATATTQASAAASSATLAAQVGSSDTNLNSMFASWTNAAAFPTYWANSSNVTPGGNLTRVGGITSAYAARVTSAAAQQTYWYQAGSGAPWSVRVGDWIVLEADITLNTGTLTGAGVLFRVNGSGDITLNFSNDKTTADVAPGAGTGGFSYSYRKLVQVTAGANNTGNQFYCMNAWTSLGSVAGANDITWYRCGFRPANSAEIAAQRADANANTALANISSEASTRASAISALSTTVNTLTAFVQPNTNLVQNPTGANGTTGWKNSNLIASVLGNNGEGYFFIATSGSSSNQCSMEQDIAVQTPGVQVSISGWVFAAGISTAGNSNARAGIHVAWINSAGNVISYTGEAATPAGAGWTYCKVENQIVPAGTVEARVRIWTYSDIGTYTVNNVAWKQIKVENSATATAYTDDATSAQLSSSVQVQAGAIASLQGRTAAYWNLNVQSGTGRAAVALQADGVAGTSQLDLVAGSINLSTTSDGSNYKTVLSTDTSGNVTCTGDIIWTNGSVMKVAGPGFGSNNQFIEWFGPKMALTSCTESNATYYLRTDGAAYFGGALSSGTLTTKAGTSDTGASATAETNVFGSNGHTITVTVSYTGAYNQTQNFAKGQTNAFNAAAAAVGANSGNNWQASGSDPGGWSVAIYRSINGGGYTQVSTLSGGGTWSWRGSPPDTEDPGFAFIANSESGSLTYTDPQQIAQDRQYKAVLTSRNPKFGITSQNISIVCVEQ